MFLDEAHCLWLDTFGVSMAYVTAYAWFGGDFDSLKNKYHICASIVGPIKLSSDGWCLLPYQFLTGSV